MEPKTTDNSLSDIINWIKEGFQVSLYADGKETQVYHNYCDGSEVLGQIFVNLNSYPSLLDDGEWSWYIESSQCFPCKCINLDCKNKYNMNLKF